MHTGKDLTEVRSPQRKLIPDIVGLELYEQTSALASCVALPPASMQSSLRGIAFKAENCKTHRFQNLYQRLDASFLMECWYGLNKDAASGVDKVTATIYQENLDANIQSLAGRLKAKDYRARLVRRCYIPKGNGKERPLGIPALEDRLVQSACAKLLGTIFEVDFQETSYGYRPGRSAKDAVQDLRYNFSRGNYGYVVEADIKGFFDNMDHNWILETAQTADR